MSVDSTASHNHCCLKRKWDQSEAIESCRAETESNPSYFWVKNQKFVEDLTKNESDCVKTCSNGKFLGTYMKHTRSIHDMLGIMDDFFHCDTYSFHPSNKIKRKFRNFAKSFQSQLNQISLELVEEIDNECKVTLCSSCTEEPAIKLKRITSHEDKDANSNIDEEIAKPKLSDSDIDLYGSDIDLHLEEAMDDIMKLERKITSNAFSKKSPGNINTSNEKDIPQNMPATKTALHEELITRNMNEMGMRSFNHLIITENEREGVQSAAVVETAHTFWSPKEESVHFEGLNFEPDGFLTVYVDGACSNNGKSTAQAGIGVWFGENHPLNISDRVRGTATNNNAEIQAATRAITQAKSIGIDKLRIYTDSQFLINCMTQWIKKWKQENWINSSKKPVINKDSLVALDEAISTITAVDWKYVPGHQGMIGNEKADYLARKGARK